MGIECLYDRRGKGVKDLVLNRGMMSQNMQEQLDCRIACIWQNELLKAKHIDQIFAIEKYRKIANINWRGKSPFDVLLLRKAFNYIIDIYMQCLCIN